MRLLRSLTFDDACKRTTAVISLLALILVLSALVNMTARENSHILSMCVTLIADLSACAVLTLYFHMAAHALSSALPEEDSGTLPKRNRIYYLADLFADLLKLFFILSPLFGGSGMYLPPIAALIADAVFSRLLLLRILEERTKTLPAENAEQLP